MPEAKIIRFPVERMKKPQDVLKESEGILNKQVNELVSDFAMQFIGTIQNTEAYAVDDPEFAEDLTFVVEAFRAALLRYKGLSHPLNTVVDVFFDDHKLDEAIAKELKGLFENINENQDFDVTFQSE